MAYQVKCKLLIVTKQSYEIGTILNGVKCLIYTSANRFIIHL